jgi:hypothetical protein
MTSKTSALVLLREGGKISELKELALAMAKKKLMKLMNLFVTVDHSFYTTLPFTPQFPFQRCDWAWATVSSDSRGERAQILGIGGSEPKKTIVREIQ